MLTCKYKNLNCAYRQVGWGYGIISDHNPEEKKKGILNAGKMLSINNAGMYHNS
jgi:hypothetical protein